MTPRPAILHGWDGSLRSADQLAEPVLSLSEGLRQGPRNDRNVRPRGQSAGVGQEAFGYRLQGLNPHLFITAILLPDFIQEVAMLDHHLTSTLNPLRGYNALSVLSKRHRRFGLFPI